MRAFHADPSNRQNNLTLLRLIAALAVMVSHAWPIVHGPGTPEPLAATGYTLGTIAVIVFFGLSGFLIAASWARRPRPGRFLAHRARRLLPGLWVMLGLSAFAMGPLVSALDPAAYLTDPGVWRFVVRNSALLAIEPSLPGVFVDNPYPAAAGSIWTLHYEAACYLALLAAGLGGCLAPHRACWALAAAVAASVLAATAGPGLHPRLSSMVLLGLPFALGVGAWVWRGRLPLAWPVIPALAAAAWLARGTLVYHMFFCGTVVYATLWAGFVPWRFGRALARASDLSYGLYLYAFPVQGLIQHLAAPEGVATHLALAVPPTIVLAWMSWCWVERPWLQAASPRETVSPLRGRRTARHGRQARARDS